MDDFKRMESLDPFRISRKGGIGITGDLSEKDKYAATLKGVHINTKKPEKSYAKFGLLYKHKINDNSEISISKDFLSPENTILMLKYSGVF